MSALEKSKTELVSAYNAAKNRLANAKKEATAITGRAVNSSLTVGTGYGVGILRNKLGKGPLKRVFVPGTEIDADLAVGVIATLAGVAGIADDKSDALAAMGSGALAGYTAISAFTNGWDLRA